jgi:2-hydroxychromene-2-carboxylate isomerase
MTNASPIEFYFDFSSPYAYLASTQIEAIATKHGREVAWHPFMLGIAFKQEGTKPLNGYKAKAEYSKHDFDRTARRLGVPFKMPSDFPKITLAASRGYYWLLDQGKLMADEFLHKIYAAYFVNGDDIEDVGVVSKIAGLCGTDEIAFRDAVASDKAKQRLTDETNRAVTEKGVFGAPYMIVDGEAFWGTDRLEQVEEWLQTGGW